MLGPSLLIGVRMVGFTSSWDEIARTSQSVGELSTTKLLANRRLRGSQQHLKHHG